METPKKSFFNLLGDRGSAHEDPDCVAAVDELVGHADNILLVRAYEAFLYRIKIMMQHTRNVSDIYDNLHVRAAADQMGFKVPKRLGSSVVFSYDTHKFAEMTRTIFSSHGVYHPTFKGNSLVVLQTVFEALELGNVVMTPVETGNKFQLDSPTGVSNAFFRMNWDVALDDDDNNDDDDDGDDDDDNDDDDDDVDEHIDEDVDNDDDDDDEAIWFWQT
jgi:hypothetical protein